MPVHIYTNWNMRSIDNEEQIEPFRKYFFICEGQNTEVWYFKNIINLRKQLGIHAAIDIRLMEKTDLDEGKSNPKALIKFANEQKEIENNNFDISYDKMIIVFDVDIYKNNPEQYKILISSEQEDNILAVTNPSFELFLLLHYENAFQKIIEPNQLLIFENKKIQKRRYIAKLFSEISGMNSKENYHIGELAQNVEMAIKEEKNINQDINLATENLTSNIGSIIEMIKNDSC